MEQKRMELLSRFSTEDRVAIVTGAGRGIGKGIALSMAQVGAHVVVVARTIADIEATAAEIRLLDRKALAVPADVTCSDQVQSMVDRVLMEFGRIDILVNNVGGVPWGWYPTLDMPDDVWDSMINLNLRSTFLCSKIVGRVMRNQKSGSIINIATAAAFQPTPFMAAYGAAKAGEVNFTISLAVQLAPYNIRVNCIAPGPIATPGMDVNDSRQWAEMYGAIWGRSGLPEDVAFAAIYLASDAANYVTGACIEVAGGPRYATTYLREAEDGWKRAGH